MSTDTVLNPDVPTSRRTVLRIAAVLTLVMLVVCSGRFARYDWTGLPLDRGPVTAERQVGPDCLEQIKPYVTESGRVISPVVVDEQQYLSLVEYFRGVPREDLQSVCLYDPFTNRSGMSWIAHWLPFEEGVAMAVTNLFMLIAGLWIVLATLRSQTSSPRALLAAGTLYTVAWNPFFFGTGVLVDSGVVAAIALCWYLLSTRRVWWIWPILFLGYPLKELIGIVVPVVWVWCWQEYCAGRRTKLAAAAPAIVSAVAFVVGVAMWRQVLVQPDASWEVTPDLKDVVSNLIDIISLGSFAVGVLPLLIPSFLWWRRTARTDGWFPALLDPAVVGVVVAIGICGWSFITVDLTPRLFWIAFPFATTLAARWFSAGRPKQWLDGLRLPAWLVG
ncbi:hypothetical protein BH10ACT3_BH10ACT3_12430 [soil metagenome]